MAKKITRTLTLFPNAKINLGLHLTGKLPNGYHTLETIYYPVFSLKDTLKIELLSEGKNKTEIFTGANIPLEQNLVYKAIESLKNVVGEVPSLRIYLEKNIPSGAGLGGGSSDAAFTLQGLNELLDLRLSTETLHSLAEALGADVPFFLYNTPMFATGTGTKLEKLNFQLPATLEVKVFPELHSDTSKAYAGVKRIIKRDYSLKEILNKPLELWQEYIFNDLEEAVFEYFPQIAKKKQAFYDSGAVFSLMSGSGSAVYGIYLL